MMDYNIVSQNTEPMSRHRNIFGEPQERKKNNKAGHTRRKRCYCLGCKLTAKKTDKLPTWLWPTEDHTFYPVNNPECKCMKTGKFKGSYDELRQRCGKWVRKKIYQRGLKLREKYEKIWS